jgi:DNA transposition AAA+ family ATPase
MTFVETSVSLEIFRTIDLARELRKNASIVGSPGVGKSRALRAYAAQGEGIIFMTATAVLGNALRDLLREVADALSLYTSGTISNMQRQLHQYDLAGHVLIIDEAQNLKLQAFRELLHLHDFTGLCLIFCGNEEVLKRVSTNRGAFAQISRRVQIRATVNSILDEDTDKIAVAFGVDGTDAHKMLRPIGRAFHTDGIVTVLDVAQRFAAAKSIKAEHIRRACEPFPHYRSLLK